MTRISGSSFPDIFPSRRKPDRPGETSHQMYCYLESEEGDMWDCRGRLESDISECREDVGAIGGTPNRLAPLLFPLAAALLAASILSGCGSGGGEAKADVQSESRGMPSDAGTGVENESGLKESGDGSKKKDNGAKSDTAGDTAGDSTGNQGTASVPDGYESGGEIAGGTATVYVPEGSSDGGTESPSSDDGLDGSIGDAEVVIAN